MVPPFMGVKDPMFCLQINVEAVWESRKVYSYPRMTFDLLQRGILQLGYQLSQSSGERFGIAVAASIRRFCQKVQTVANGKIRISRCREKAATQAFSTNTVSNLKLLFL